MNKYQKWFFSFLILQVLLFVFPRVSNALSRNKIDIQAVKAVFSSSLVAGKIATALEESFLRDCRGIWLYIQLTNQADHQNEYQAAIACSNDYIRLVAINRPFELDLAQQAIKQKPEDAKVWFWLAEAQAAAHLPEALDSYKQVVSLNMFNGLAWCRLGSAYEQKKQLMLARDAYLQCCNNNDKGANGCFGAGRMEEMLGNPKRAIEYYRLSHWEGSLKRADDLEKQFVP